MIRKVEGDILLTKSQAIAHGIAPFDDFKNGLALSLREHWPALYKDLRHYCHESTPKSGTLWSWVAPTKLRIVNLFTQDAASHQGAHPGAARLEYVNHSLKELREWIIAEKIQSIALPRIATGVGRLSWDDVLPLIEKHLGGLEAEVTLYTTFKKGVAAE